MSPELMYLKFLQKVNKNSTQFNITCDRARFVLIINEVKNRWVEYHLKDKDSILIDKLREIIKPISLVNGLDKGDFVEYTIPLDFYEGSLAKSLCEKDDCKATIFSREVKNQNKNILQWDDNQKPDFDFRWTFHSIQGEVIRVYKTDFKVIKTDLEYYSALPEFDMVGYTDIDNKPSTNKPIDILSDQYIDQIVSLAAEEFMRDYQDSNGLLIAKDRTSSVEKN